MKKILLLNLLLAMLLGATSAWAADGEIFQVRTDKIMMRFKVISESDKTCETCSTRSSNGGYDPAIERDYTGHVIVPETANGYTVIRIGAHSFFNCSFPSIQLPETVTMIEEWAFNRSKLETIDVPSKVDLGSYTFNGCTELTSVSISCDNIPRSCFNECENLSSLELRSPVSEVGQNAFTRCYHLESISFPTGLIKIGSYAFGSCTHLKLITLPSSLESICSDSFWECQELENVIIESETPPSIIQVESYEMFSGISDNAVLTVPDRTKYLSEPWASKFSEIKSFLPTYENTRIFYNMGSYGWGWPVYTNDPNEVLDLKIDGNPAAPTFYGTDIIISNDPKYIPLEVSFLLKTDEGIQPNIIHYDLIDYGFSIDGKEMTSRDFNNVPGVVSGNAYLKDEVEAMRWAGAPTLVLDNATLEWDTTGYGLHNHDTGQDGLTIKVLGDCTIKAPNAVAALEIDVANMITIEGGGTLHIISGQYPIETWVVSTLRIQDGTTVIAESETGRSALWDQDGADIEIRDGGVFAAFGKHEPIWLDSNGEFILGEGIALRYPTDAYIGSNNNIYYADGTKVTNDWVVPRQSDDTRLDSGDKQRQAGTRLQHQRQGNDWHRYEQCAWSHERKCPHRSKRRRCTDPRARQRHTRVGHDRLWLA